MTTTPTSGAADLPEAGCSKHHLIHCSQCRHDNMVRDLRAENDRLTTQLAALATGQATAAPAQADTQPAPVLDYPPLPECQGKIFDDGYWIQNKLGPKRDVMGGAKVWLESQVRAAIDADRAARAPADSVQEDAARYRWLAANCRSTSEHWGGRWSIVIEGPAPKSHNSEDDFDAAVDAARKQGASQ